MPHYTSPERRAWEAKNVMSSTRIQTETQRGKPYEVLGAKGDADRKRKPKAIDNVAMVAPG